MNERSSNDEHAGAPSVGETGRRKWRIDVSSESTRLSIPQGMQAFRVSVEDSILMEKTRDVLKSLETSFEELDLFLKSWAKICLRLNVEYFRHIAREVKITELELINHLLSIEAIHNNFSLLDVNGKCPFLIPKPCGSYEIDPSYCLSDGVVERMEIGTYVKPFLEPHTQLAALVAFTQKDHVQSQVEQVLHEFVLDFLSRHTRVIGELYSDDRLNLRTLLHSVRDELLAQSIIYDCLSTIITADIWNYKTVDCFLDRFFATTMYAELGPSAVRKVIGRLQHAVLPIFDRYFDGLFSTGEIDPVLENEFVFQNIEGSMALQKRQTHCVLWTRPIIRYVQSGTLNARRLCTGNCDYEAPEKFSFYRRKALQQLKDCTFLTVHQILHSVEYACKMCAINNSSVLFRFVMANGALPQILKEVESIFTGFAVREMAFDLFGATRDSQHCSIVLSFQNSLLLTGFAAEVCERWTIRCDSGLLDDLVIKPQLSWPIYYVIEDSLLLTLNMCLRFLLKLLQAQEALLSVRIELATTKELNISRHRLNHLICYIAQPLTAISEIFFTHLQAMLAKKFALVIASNTLEEAQQILLDLNKQLTNLVSRSGSRGLVHDAVSKLCDRATEVEMRWRLDTVSLRDVEKVLKAVKREKDLLFGLGRSMHGTIFTLLQPLLT